MANSLKEVWTVYRIVPNMRPTNIQGDVLVTGELVIKTGFPNSQEAEDWLLSLPNNKFREENLYEVRKSFKI